MFLPHPLVKLIIVGSLGNREVACSASDSQGSSFESCVWRTVSSHSSHHPQEVLLAQFILYVHRGGLKPDSFHFGHRRRRWSNTHPELFQCLVFAASTASSTCDVIFMNDKFERRGLIKFITDSLIMLIIIVDRSSNKCLNKHNNNNKIHFIRTRYNFSYYYCLTVRIVYNMFVQHLCVTPVCLCRTRGPWTQTHRIVNPLRPDNHDNKTDMYSTSIICFKI